jgi:hypothetical protein
MRSWVLLYWIAVSHNRTGGRGRRLLTSSTVLTSRANVPLGRRATATGLSHDVLGATLGTLVVVLQRHLGLGQPT